MKRYKGKHLKFDLHCHTKEGSLDAKVPVAEYARTFKTLGYDGFMITDHNSYKGCKAWDKIKNSPEFKDFCVLRGIEYDTRDAGHILVIMPDDLYLPILHIRGMRLSNLIRIVHHFGGILGLAHPFGISSSSAMGFKKMNKKLIKDLDFIETFNTCESKESNINALKLAKEYNLPGFAGSDCHVTDYIGMASTNISAKITCNNDFIKALKESVPISAEGIERGETIKGKMKGHWTSIWGYRIYNRGVGKLIYPYRKFLHNKLLVNMLHHQ